MVGLKTKHSRQFLKQEHHCSPFPQQFTYNCKENPSPTAAGKCTVNMLPKALPYFLNTQRWVGEWVTWAILLGTAQGLNQSPRHWFLWMSTWLTSV